MITLTSSIREKFLKGYNLACEKVKGANALKSNASESEFLYNCITSAHSELEQAVSTFNELTEDKAIDYASYNLLAAKAKYSYLLKLAKEKNLSL